LDGNDREEDNEDASEIKRDVQPAFREQKKSSLALASSAQRPRCLCSVLNGRKGGEEIQEVAAEQERGYGSDNEPELKERGEKRRHSETKEEDNSD